MIAKAHIGAIFDMISKMLEDPPKYARANELAANPLRAALLRAAAVHPRELLAGRRQFAWLDL